ncbi:MAG: glycosyltransferase family 39 protein, partial [Rhodospirillaceae bacterium]|nr:glycosyltransferase family 39 protein [Rhodospirillaceae bacterium]
MILTFTVFRLWALASPPMPLSMDEAQYWLWSQDLAFGYYSKPPLLAWIIAATTAVCGEGEGCIRLSSPLFHAGTALLLFGIGQRLFDSHVGAWSAVTYIALPGVSVSSVVASTDAPLLFFWALALYALVRLRANPKTWLWILLGVALGFGALSKYAMLFFVLGLAVWAAVDRGARILLGSRGAGVAAVVALLIILPNILWNADHAFVSVTHVADNMALAQARFSLADMLDFVGAQAGILGPVLFIAFVGALVRWPPQFKPQLTLLICFCAPVLLLMTLQAFLSRAHANWAATAYIAAVPVVVAWCLSRNWASWLRVSWVLHMVAAVVITNY